MMPEMNGFQVLERMKADARLRHVPVIMISALDELDSVVRCIEMGAEDYLPKPFNPVLLKARVGACLEKKRFRDREVDYLRQIEAQKKRADELLHVILPDEIVDGAEGDQRGQAAPLRRTSPCSSATSSASRPTASRHEPEEVVVPHLPGAGRGLGGPGTAARRPEDQDHRRRLHGRLRPAQAGGQPRARTASGAAWTWWP